MTQRVLLHLSCLAVLGATAGPMATPVQAQCSTSVVLTAIGDETIGTTNRRPVGLADCNAGKTLTVQLTGPKQAIGYWATYFTGGTENCASSSVRNADETREACNQLATQQVNSAPGDTLSIEVPLTAELCEYSQAKLYVMYGPNEDFSTVDATGDCFELGLTVDTTLPAAPTGLNEPSGENVLELRWNRVEDDSIEDYVVFIDTTATDSGTNADAAVAGACVSTLLQPGATLDTSDLPAGVVTRTTSGTTVDISTSLLSSDLAVAAVASRDEAGNVGTLSELSCLTVVETQGYWETYRAAGGENAGGCACSALGAAQTAGAMPALLALLGLRARSRRRKS